MRMGSMKSLLVAGLTLLVVSQSFAASEPRKPVAKSAPRLALVIGNTNYVKLGSLSNPGQDARLIAERLRQLGFDVTEAADRELKSMAADVEDFARKIRERGPDTVSVLYYAGHGVENGSTNYLVP